MLKAKRVGALSPLPTWKLEANPSLLHLPINGRRLGVVNVCALYFELYTGMSVLWGKREVRVVIVVKGSKI